MTQQVPAADTPSGASKHVGLYDDDFLEALRRQMLRFATLQLSDAHLAEDAVQEALIGALRNARSFSGRAALKTWVFAILKNKIADILRQRLRVVDASSLLREDDEDEDFSVLFNRRGFWQADEHPATWGNPHESLRESQFWRVFETCLEGLPGNQARVFMMREFIELDSSEICASVGITTSNLNVMLYRARMRLRECLENRWFANGEQAC
ncbi:RNA polymerase factor sigma-70 [Aromatoleum diolicum]|uniref:RNA polymerase factor sigma-70 n=1 Tax=Aromatoleum diolicum TaxID=75796 RepID=A0ABX1Q8A5_9RHOO|nr:RNA polymerase factor sigma-70 [Aromatoleum diolicum]NMG73241.1 RNA polymerase factor sigma-70 [Aromatoleum diolicum]